MNNDYNFFRPCAAIIKSLSLMLVLHIGPVWALSSDKDQPIHIEADKVDIDDKRGVSTYSGKVKLVQGTMKVEAQRITVYSDDRKLNRVIATGSPAQFTQRPDGEQDDVQATALQVDYSAISGILTLTEQAAFVQGRNRFQGNRIEYETFADLVRASAKESGEQRVKVVIQPETLKKSADK